MNIDDNNPEFVGNDDDLESFENLFYGKTEAKAEDEPEDAPEDDPEDDEVDEEEDVDSGDVDDPATEDDDDEDDGEEDEDEEPEPEPKPKKKSFQDRINELTAKAREAERRESDLLKRLEELEKGGKKEVKEEPKPAAKVEFDSEAPQPDALDEDGELLYPLGEFDPKFIRDLTRFTIERETARVENERKERERVSEIEVEKQKVVNHYQERLVETEKEIPDIREKIEVLTETFKDVEPSYGEYLATTIMSCENGPAILYYLSQNLSEADRIVKSGAASATLAIGRLEALLERDAPVKEKRNKTKVSDAPEPPKNRIRGSGARTTIKPDTDDLEAFERAFFNKK